MFSLTVGTWFVCLLGHQWRGINLQKKREFSGGVLAVSPMFKSAKGWR